MNNITEFILSFFPAQKNVSNNIVVKNLDVYFFSTSWCPHSAKKIPNWKEFVFLYNYQIINGYKINCIDVDCSDKNNQTAIDLIKSMNIEVYPCVKIVKDEDRYEDLEILLHNVKILKKTATKLLK